jgi:DNA-binding response OmpR family regulator
VSVLVVDDDRGIRDAVAFARRSEGIEVETAADGARALDLAQREPRGMAVPDPTLPQLSGTEVCRRLRATGDAVPIAMLAARDVELDRVVGLEVGADDDVTTPFSTRELLSRVRAILRRQELDRRSTQHAVERIGGVKRLALLAEEHERVLTRRRLVEHLREGEWIGDEHAADVHISSLRRKLERDPRSPERIVTVRGCGYNLVAA